VGSSAAAPVTCYEREEKCAAAPVSDAKPLIV